MKPILIFNILGPFVYYFFSRCISRERELRIFFILVALHIFIFQSFFSYEPFPDIEWYNDAFGDLSHMTILEFLKSTPLSFEPGYVMFTKIIATVFPSDRYMYVLRGGIVAISVVHFIKQHSFYPLLSVVYYFMFFGGEQSLFVVRQYLGIVIYLWAIDAIFEKRVWKYILIWFLAFCFHKSTIVFLPLYFIYWMNITNKRILLILFFALITVCLFRTYSFIVYPLLGLYETYTQSLRDDGQASAGMFLRALVIFIPFMLFCRNRIVADKYAKLSFYILVFNLFFSIIIIGVPSGSRLYTNYSALTIIVIPYIASTIKNNSMKWEYTIITLLIFVGLYIHAGDEYGYLFMWEGSKP